MQKTVKCKVCGKRENLTKWNKDYAKELVEKKLCFDCDHWTLVLEHPNSFLYRGTAYTIADENSKDYFRGYGGREFKIVLEDGETITSSNVWNAGAMPERFHSQMRKAILVTNPHQQLNI